MKKFFKFLLLFIAVLVAAGFIAYKVFIEQKREINVLIFSKTEGFRHASIEDGKAAIIKLGKENDFRVDTTEDASVFKEKELKKYNVVIFLSTTGDVLNDAQQLEFNRFIQAGGGFVGIHAAADTEYDWPWYGKLCGAYFNGHPNDPNVREAIVRKVDDQHASCTHLPAEWKRFDEWYNYKEINPNINILLNLDESTYEGGTNGENHPMAWYHEFDGGRSFYTGLGHTSESFVEENFLKLLWGGIDYAAGLGQPVNYSISTVAPEENRFVKEVLDEGLNEPMELEYMPDGSILFIERGGAIKQYQPKLKETRVVATMNVHAEHEDGLLGLALDPNYATNNWVYFFYSPVGEEAKQHVSRFVLKDGEIDFNTEKVLLEIPTQREECCHSAGALEFDKSGNLFISVGDNSNPHFSDGYAPSDEGEDRGPWDAQKSASNTNDFRGKILKITPQADGTYTIPDGNLFPKDATAGKPEIYVMGCRNPFRFAIDDHTGYLYWGDVGPDAGEDSLGRGPKGYDEVNQAREPGFYGWPYFVGDNYAYNKYDYIKKVSGEKSDPAKPVNTSPHNTGAKELPPAKGAYIWYPYGASTVFPQVGDGGRNAMAAGVYYYNDFKNKEKQFPEYYDGKLFIYDWMRGWIMAVTMEENGDYKRMERFLPSQRFSNPTDIVFGPDGDIFMIEYGTVWFSENPDARLVHIRYVAGNRQPVARMSADNFVGKAPLTIQFKGDESVDFDGDELKYEWRFGDAGMSDVANPNFTFEKTGEYKVALKVTDAEGNWAKSETEILVGNEVPKVAWNIVGNKTFYFDNQKIDYSVEVSDAEDGDLGNGINVNAVNVSIDYLERGNDANEVAIGHKALREASAYTLGKKLMNNSDCTTCHQMSVKSVGPSYQEISQKYKSDPGAIQYLAQKVIKGGGGVWGEAVMAAHPQLTNSEAEQMSKYILSLSGEAKLGNSLPTKGSFVLNQHQPQHTDGRYIFTAAYTDKGGAEIGSLTARDIMILRSPTIISVNFDEIVKAMKFKVEPGMAPGVEEEMNIIVGVGDGYVAYKNLDLTGVTGLEVGAAQAGTFFGGGTIEIHIDQPDGEVIGSFDIVQGLTDFGMKSFTSSLKATEGIHDVYTVFKAADKEANKPVCAVIFYKFLVGEVQ
ncbi:MAG: cytochrome c [Saprospiraceae bacterium]|jgi:cytochrome c